MSGVNFEGTLFVNYDGDGDWMGAIFSFQDSSNFYLLMSAKGRIGQALISKDYPSSFFV